MTQDRRTAATEIRGNSQFRFPIGQLLFYKPSYLSNLSSPHTLAMAENRLARIAGHLNFPKGMLVNQVAIITGSGQGIGAEAAKLFANEGAKVIVQDIDAGYSAFP